MDRDLSGIHVWLVLWKTSRAVQRCAEDSIEALNMCHSDFGVLEALLNKGPLPVNQIGQKVLLTSGSITTAVDRLEKKGLVERKDSLHDRRTRIVHLTSQGGKLIQKAYADHAAEMEHFAAVLGSHERAALLSLLKKLGRQAEQQFSQTRIGTRRKQ
jgi:MarR family 2-MHQ and catechol resistance regulon transcriptional repressor